MRSKLLFLIVLIAAYAIGSAFAANSLLNPGFEDADGTASGVDEWWIWPEDIGLVYHELNALAHGGNDFMELAYPPNTWGVFFQATGSESPAIPGNEYTFGAYMRLPAGGSTINGNMKVEWYANAGEEYTAVISDPEQPITIDSETWTQIAVTVTAPSGANFAKVVFIASNDPYYIDDAFFCEGTSPCEAVAAFDVHSPSPADGAGSVPSSTTILSWETDSFDGRFPKVEVYWGTQGDPNFWGFTGGGGEPIQISYLADANLIGHQIDLSAIPGPLGGPIALLPNEIYYWGLKYEDPNVIGQVAYWGNPVLLEGPAWTFDTINQPPVVDAGPHADRWLPSAGSVKVGLDGSYTDDGLPAGGPVTYKWESSPACIPCFTPSNTVEDPNFETSTAGDYLLTLTVNDGGPGSDGDDTVLVRIFAHGDDRLRAHYPLDTDPCDIAGGHNGTLEDNPTFNPSGQVAGAIELDGNDDVDADGKGDFVSIDDTGSDPNFQPDTWENSGLIDGMTVSVWMNLADGWSKSYEALVSKSNYSWELLRDGTNNGVAFSIHGDIGYPVSSADADVTSGWHQVVGVYNRNEVLVYVDGLLEGTVDAGTINLEANPQNTQDWQIQKAAGKICIGQTNNLDTPDSEFSFGGLIDQVRIFDAAVPGKADPTGTPGIAEMYRADGGHINCGDDYIASDVNEDCYVTLGDFALVALNWLECNDAANADCD